MNRRDLLFIISILSVFSIVIRLVPLYFLLHGDIINGLLSWYIIWAITPFIKINTSVGD